MIGSVADRVLKLLYPHTCPFCGQVSKEEVCNICKQKLVYVSEPRCKQCSKPLFREEQEYCHDCIHGNHQFDRGFSLWLHENAVLDSIYQFKYHNRRIFARFYASEIWKRYRSDISMWAIDLIIPIPLHKNRKKQRGYNQAELLAKEIALYIGAPVMTKTLIRKKETKRQKELNASARKRNMKRVFAVTPGFEAVTSVLLIDDIYTTGSTLDAAAKVLKLTGIQKVYFLTISIGQGY